MSILNYVLWECDTPLPDGWNGKRLQTRYFEDILGEDYKVTADGSLLISSIVKLEKVPKEKRPFPNAPEGTFKALFGSTRIETELVPFDLTGYIELEGYEEETGIAHDYMAKFKNGKLVKIITRAEYERLIADV